MFSQFVFTTPDVMSHENQIPEEKENDGEGDAKNKPGQEGKPGGLSGGGAAIDDKHKGKKGTIIVEFYKTREF